MEHAISRAEFTAPSLGQGPPPAPLLTYRQVDTRHGRFRIYDEDELVGLSLATYGEYSQGEVIVFSKCIKPGMTVVEVGANIGAFAVPIAKLVGDTGRLIALEAARVNYDIMVDNLETNGVKDLVHAYYCAASDHAGEIKVSKQDALHAYCRPDLNEGEITIPSITIDSLKLPSCHFIKIDVDRHELQVLKGAEQTIHRHRPILYVENEDPDLATDLIAWIVDHGYRCYWHRPSHFNPRNFRGETRNYFGNLVSVMMLCVPEPAWDGMPWDVRGLDEVADIRLDARIFDRESERYQDIVRRSPDDLMARLMVAHYENLMQRDPWPWISDNLTRNPDHKPTLNVRGLLKLQRGHYREGWEAYELRFFNRNTIHFGGNRVFSDGQTGEVPHWNGEPTDAPVLIWSEQGFGDQIMFARLFKRVKERAPNAFFEVAPELFELFDGSRDLLGIGPEDLFRLRRSLPPFTMQCSMASLPHTLHVDADMIARLGGAPYLRANSGIRDNWLGQGNHAFSFGRQPLNECTIGLCSFGSLTSERPYTRDIPKKTLAPFIKRHGPFFSLEQGGQFESFATTAGAIAALDLVITVDTAVAHLAGAMGREVWLLLALDPDWRWGLNGSGSVWYPSMRIFRQTRVLDWEGVLDCVSAALAARMATPAPEVLAAE